MKRNETITKKQLNTYITVMLIWGYLINAVVTFFLGDYFMYHGRATIEKSHGLLGGIHSFDTSYLFVALLVIAIGCGIGIFCTDSVKGQMIIFHISALITSPLIIEIFRMLEGAWHNEELGIKFLRNFTGRQLSVFWILAIVYVIVLYLLSCRWEKMFTKMRYTLAAASAFDLVYIAAAFFLTGKVLVPAFAFTFVLFYIGMVWTTTNMDRQEYNSYYVMMSTGKLMNLVGTAFGQQGRGRWTAWLK